MGNHNGERGDIPLLGKDGRERPRDITEKKGLSKCYKFAGNELGWKYYTRMVGAGTSRKPKKP